MSDTSTEQHEATDEDETTTTPSTEGLDQPDEQGDAPAAETSQARRDERWRQRARTAEDRLARAQHREVGRLLAARVNDPEAALTLSGEQVVDLLDDDGEVDVRAVGALAEAMLSKHPSLRMTGHHNDLAARKPIDASPGTTWSGLIKGER